jgi:hypothetical protein
MNLVLIVFLFIMMVGASVFSQQAASLNPNGVLIYKKYKLHHSPPQPASKPDDITIFIHAAVGIFPIKRKRPGQIRDTWVRISFCLTQPCYIITGIWQGNNGRASFDNSKEWFTR